MAENSGDGDPKSYAERLDPGGAIGKQAQGLALVAGSRLGRGLLRRLGVQQTILDQAVEASATYERLISAPDRIAALLGPLGWIPHNLAHAAAYDAAATLAEKGKVEEAEELLVTAYNEADQASIRFYHRVFSLYQGDERRRAIGLARSRLLDEAYELHSEGRYAGAISIVLAQIDGIFIDMTGKPAKTFYNSDNPNLVDDVTIAGHPQGLQALSELMSREQRKTTVSDKLTRQGILHGRVLAYDTLRNATKVWAALLAVIEAVGPRAKELNEQAAAEHEQRWAGSTKLDEWGRRRDQRGLETARAVLHRVHLYQHGHLVNHGRFAPDQRTLDADGRLLRADDVQLEIVLDEDGGYRAWTPTPPGVFFGLAARDDDFNNYWVYLAEEPPAGGIDEDARWTHILEAEYADW